MGTRLRQRANKNVVDDQREKFIMPPALDKARLLSQAPKLDLTVVGPPDFKAWKRKYESFTRMSGLTGDEATEQDRVDFLDQCLTDESLTIVMNMGLTDAEMANTATVVTKIETYVDGRVNTTVEHRKLRDRRQQAGEKVDDYVISLRELAKTCAFCNNACMEAAIRDQLVEGLENAEIVDELLKQ